MYRTPVFAAIALAAGLAITSGQARSADAAIEALLKQAHTPFEIDKDGDYKIVIEWKDEKRSQLVYIGGTPETLNDIRIYDVFAPALAVDDGGLGQADANALLKASGDLKLGAWELRGDGAYFVAKVPAGNLTAAQFDKILSLVAETADNFERDHSQGKSDDL